LIFIYKRDNILEKILTREIIFRGKYLNLEKLQIGLPDGRYGEREIVRVRNAVAVLLVDDKRNVHLVRQHRSAIEQTILEAPAGLLNDGEEPAAAAVRESEEETGYRPLKLRQLITYAHAEGYSTGFITLFLGTQLNNTGKICLDSSEYLEQVTVPFDKLAEMVKENQIIDSKTILCTILSKKMITEL
jgi:ADP-ribose pyrophosphatase